MSACKQIIMLLARCFYHFQNKTSHMYYWPGCEVQIRGLRPTFCFQYGGIPTFDELHFAINESLAFLQTGKTDFAGKRLCTTQAML